VLGSSLEKHRIVDVEPKEAKSMEARRRIWVCGRQRCSEVLPPLLLCLAVRG
jgi:hypothetical protein